MKNFKYKYLTLIIEGILFLIWNILVWTLCPLIFGMSRAASYFWIAYTFNVVAFVSTAVVLYVIKGNKYSTFSVRSPAYVFSAIYFFVTIAMNSVFIALAFHIRMNIAASLTPNLVIFLLYVAAVIISLVSISRNQTLNKEIDEKYTSLKSLGIKVGTVATLAEDADVKRALYALREAIDYSDPMGKSETKSSEADLNSKVDEIQLMVESGDPKEAILKKITAANTILAARNETLRLAK